MAEIKYPVQMTQDSGTIEFVIRDASGRVIADRLIGIDAAEIVRILNAAQEEKPLNKGLQQALDDSLKKGRPSP